MQAHVVPARVVPGPCGPGLCCPGPCSPGPWGPGREGSFSKGLGLGCRLVRWLGQGLGPEPLLSLQAPPDPSCPSAWVTEDVAFWGS